MNSLGLIFLLLNGILLLVLPRRYAAIPLIAGSCYMSFGQGFHIGPFSFSIIRALIFFGLIRIVLRSERPENGWTPLDTVILGFCTWLSISSFFYDDIFSSLVFRLGRAYNVIGIYTLFRCFCGNSESYNILLKATIILIVPLAAEMLQEQITGKNLFSYFGGVPEDAKIRDGRIRSQGPFSHPILAGTIGATILPLLFSLKDSKKKLFKIGVLATLTIVATSASSGPLVSLIFGIAALVLWRYQKIVKFTAYSIFPAYLILAILMERPVYYLITYANLTGSSTGWHRAKLIDSAISHLNEWWLHGTNYTRHWMPTGVSWSPDHADITNDYINWGVVGGLPLTTLYIVLYFVSFKLLRKEFGTLQSRASKFQIWCIGASLFAHATTAISVSYFGQAFVFLFMNFALASNMHNSEELFPDSDAYSKLNKR